ncbi:MAG: putative Ig domain-containing protein [Planctomycetaceae bacterium]|nr:putative Ig domain-containing protein [Planctomycetaceae bacterium]
MQRREKILLSGLLAVAVGWQGWPMVRNTFYGPIEERESQLQSLRAKVGKKQDQNLESLRAAARLKEMKAASLPPNELIAQRVYQEWLTDTALACGFEDLRVISGRRAAMGISGMAVQVSVEGTATLGDLARFLQRFRRIALLHRLTQITTESTSSQGDPRLKVAVVAEGLCLRDTKERGDLFPTAQLKAEMSRGATQLTVDDPSEFPKEPGFRIAIDGEYLTVTAINGAVWTVTRGVEGTTIDKHANATRVQLAPVLPSAESLTFDEAARLIADNPFAKKLPARPYAPKFGPIASQSVTRGSNWRLKVPLADVETERGAPAFTLGEKAPPGLKLDGKTGELSWSTSSSLPLGNYPVSISVTLPGVEKPLIKAFDISVKEPNAAPKIASTPSQTVYLGGTLVVPLKATDDGPAGNLVWKLEGAPAGASINSRTGELRWTPADAQEPGEVTLRVTVSDGESPPLSTSQAVTVKVEEDVAAETYLVGGVSQDGATEAWLYDRANNRRMLLTRGSTFRIADVAGRVREIELDSVKIELSPGKESKLALGETVRSLKPLSQPAAATPEPPPLDEPAVAEIPVKD